MQNYAARWVHHDYSHYTSVSSLQKQLNWPFLSVRRLQSRLVLFYKICHQNIIIPIPPYLKIPLITTRHSSNINENSYRYRQFSTSTDPCKYSYFPQTITDWSSLPPSLCATPTVQSFKEGLTRHHKFLHGTANINFFPHGVTCDRIVKYLVKSPQVGYNPQNIRIRIFIG